MKVFLLNGWSARAAFWREALECDPFYREWQVIDLARFQSWAQLASFLEQNLTPEDGLAGWSLGGMLAMRYVARASTAPARLITFNANLRFVRAPAYPTAMHANDFNAFFALVTERPAAIIARRFVALMAYKGMSQAERKTLLSLYQASDLPHKEVLVSQLNCLREIDCSRAQAGRIGGLHLLGRHDALVPVDCAKALAHRTGGDVGIYEGGHVPFLNAWKEVSSYVTRYIKDGTGASA